MKDYINEVLFDFELQREELKEIYMFAGDKDKLYIKGKVDMLDKVLSKLIKVGDM